MARRAKRKQRVLYFGVKAVPKTAGWSLGGTETPSYPRGESGIADWLALLVDQDVVGFFLPSGALFMTAG